MFSFESAWQRPEKDKTKKRVYCNILKTQKKKKKKESGHLLLNLGARCQKLFFSPIYDWKFPKGNLKQFYVENSVQTWVFNPFFLLEEKSKKISNDQELIQSDPISCPQNQKGNN